MIHAFAKSYRQTAAIFHLPRRASWGSPSAQNFSCNVASKPFCRASSPNWPSQERPQSGGLRHREVHPVFYQNRILGDRRSGDLESTGATKRWMDSDVVSPKPCRHPTMPRTVSCMSRQCCHVEQKASAQEWLKATTASQPERVAWPALRAPSSRPHRSRRGRDIAPAGPCRKQYRPADRQSAVCCSSPHWYACIFRSQNHMWQSLSCVGSRVPWTDRQQAFSPSHKLLT